MQFGADQSGGVQCSVVRLRQSSAVLSSQAQYSPLTCSPVQSFAVQSTLVRCSPFSSNCSLPSNSIQSLLVKCISVGRSPGPL